MSAYICDPEHIKALAVYAVTRGKYGRNVEPQYVLSQEYGTKLATKADWEIATVYADLLYQENIRSVQARYPEDKWDELSGPCEKPEHLAITAREQFHPAKITPIAILKMCNCLEYQSCETSDWRETIAYKLMGQIKDAAISQLPGYEEAPWEYAGPESITKAKKNADEAADFARTYSLFAD